MGVFLIFLRPTPPARRMFFLLLLSLAALFSLPLLAQQSYSITINNVPKQKLLHIGASSVPLQPNVPTWATDAMADSIYKTLRFNALRLWVHNEDYKSLSDMMAEFDSWYLQSGILAAAQQRGVNTLLLAPFPGSNTITEPMTAYANKLAEFIRKLRDERSVNINVTGVANEPPFTVQQMTDAVKLLRKALDARGLNNVQIVAPEAASADNRGFSLVDGIKNDADAWSALYGIASHSYNMAANKQWENSIQGAGKQYWMTEASDNGNEGANDDTRAATIAARFLNDMNHSVDNWFFFIGYSSSTDVTTDGDNATKLMVYDIKTGKVFPHLKYFYFKQLRTVFDYGAVFREATSTSEGDMVYTYGHKPSINAAAAKNEDGSWALSVVNLTGINATWYGEAFYPAATYNVTIQVKELANVAQTSFRLYRSSGAKRFVDDGIVTAKNGSLTITVSPKELVSLRSLSSVVTKADQTISFNAIGDKTFGDAPFAINAAASSGLPVSFRVLSGPATVAGNLVTLSGTGTVVIEAAQTGNDNYNAAPSVTQSFVVAASQTATSCSGTGSILYEQWNGVAGNNIDNRALFQTAPSLTKTLSLLEGPTDVADNYASRIRGYLCPPQSGNYTFWISGDDASELWLSTDETPTNKARIAYVLEWTWPREWNKYPSQKSTTVYLQAGQRYYIEALHKEGGGGDNLAVAWQLPNGTLEAPIGGNHLIPYSTTTTVVLKEQTINFPVIADRTLGDAPFTLTATASSGLPVSFRIASGPATIAAGTVTVTGTGTVVIEAAQSGDATYKPAATVTQSFTVAAAIKTKADQTISIAAIADKIFGVAPFTITATSSSGLPVNFRVVSGPATVSGATLTLSGTGTVTMEATQGGNDNYKAAAPVTQSFAVTAPATAPFVCSATGTVLREKWDNLKGKSLSTINLQAPPTNTVLLNAFESWRDIDDNYGLRIRGYLCPPLSGNYTFWIAGDEAGALYLSTDDDPAGKTKIAGFDEHTDYRQWNKYPSQKSAAIYLEAGKRYYIEALLKEEIGPDHLSVAWQLPDGTMEAPIPGSRLSAYNTSAITKSGNPLFLPGVILQNTVAAGNYIQGFPYPAAMPLWITAKYLAKKE